MFSLLLGLKVNVGSRIFNGMGRRMHQDKKIHTYVYFPQYRALTSEKRKYLKPKGPIGTPTTSQNSSTQIKDEKVKLMISVSGF